MARAASETHAIRAAPNFDPIVREWRQTGICYIGLGVIVLFFGASVAGFSLFEKVSDFGQIAKFAAGLISLGACQLFYLGRRRFERIGFVRTLQIRWQELASDHR